MKNIAIIGAGLSGLVTAWYLNEFHPGASVTVFEAGPNGSPINGPQNSKKGGQIATDEYEGVLLETGPAFLALENPVLHNALSKIETADFKVDLELHKDEKGYVIKDTYYQKAPGGFMEFEHGRLSFLSGGLASMFALKKKVPLWDSVSFFDFLKSTYGTTYAETLGSAFARNVFYTEAENLNFRAAFPGLYDELKKGLSLKETLQKHGSDKAAFWQKELNHSFAPGIYSCKGGLEKIIDALISDLKTKNCRLEFAKIHEITGHPGEYALHSKKSKYGPFDKIIAATNAGEQAVFWHSFNKEISQHFGELKHRPVSYVYGAYNFKEFNRAGLGFFAPRKEKLTISGALYMNAFNKDFEKKNQFVTRTIIPGDHSLFSDQELVDIQINDFEKVFSLKARPLWSKVYRRASAGPVLDNQYSVWKKSLREMLQAFEGITVIGNDMSGGDINQVLEEAYLTAKNTG